MNFALLCLACVFLQATILHRFQWHDGAISPVMVALCFGATRFDRKHMIFLALLCGFCEDVLSGSGFAWSIATTASVMLVFRIEQIIATDQVVAFACCVASITALRDMLYWSIAYIGAYPLELLTHNIHMSLWNACFTGLTGAVFVHLRRRLSARRLLA